MYSDNNKQIEIMKTITQEQMQILLTALEKREITKQKFQEIVKLLNDSLI